MRCAGALSFFGDGGGKSEVSELSEASEVSGMRGEEFDFSDSYDGSDSWLLSLGDEIFLVLKGDFYQKKY